VQRSVCEKLCYLLYFIYFLFSFSVKSVAVAVSNGIANKNDEEPCAFIICDTGSYQHE